VGVKGFELFRPKSEWPGRANVYRSAVESGRMSFLKAFLSRRVMRTLDASAHCTTLETIRASRCFSWPFRSRAVDPSGRGVWQPDDAIP
jgi:hypothetical protein